MAARPMTCRVRSGGDRPCSQAPPLDRAAFRRRNRIERFFAELKHNGAIATRYEKHDAKFLALLKLGATRNWLRTHESVS